MSTEVRYPFRGRVERDRMVDYLVEQVFAQANLAIKSTRSSGLRSFHQNSARAATGEVMLAVTRSSS